MTDPESCATGWQYFDGSCYKVMSQSLAFQSARNSCLTQGAELVKISSEEENAFVRNSVGGEAWIGLEKAQDGSFYWKDGSALSFTKWKGGLPGSDSCVVMEVNGTWRNSVCSFTPGKYICEQGKYKRENVAIYTCTPVRDQKVSLREGFTNSCTRVCTKVKRA